MHAVFRTGAVLIAVAFLVSSCGNTIRGMGKDAAGAVNATQDAAKRVDNAAKH